MQKVTSKGVSKRPLCGSTNSLDLKVRLLDCIFTAKEIVAKSDPRGLSNTNLVRVKEHNLKLHNLSWMKGNLYCI